MAESFFDTASTRVRVQGVAPNTVRVTHAPLGTEAFPADRPWLRHICPALADGPAGATRLRVAASQGCVQVRTAEGALVMAEARPAQVGLRRRKREVVVDIPAIEVRHEVDVTAEAVRLAVAINPGEGFYGWGEWFNAFRRERGQIKLRIRDAVTWIQQWETYSAIPMCYSSRGYALWLLNSHESTWNINPEKGVLEIEAAGPGADYVVFYGPRFRDILQTYTALTGRPPLLPRWALGLMVTGYPQEHQDVMLERAQEHRRRDIPLDGLILDYHWEERFHNFKWRRALFPAPDRLIAGLKAQGVRLGLIFTPFVNRRNRPGPRRLANAVDHNIPAGCERDDERALPEYEEALANHYLAHPDTTWWLGAGGMVDFTNPAAAAWWNARLRPLYEQGIAFFKNDDGEYLPRDATSALGLTGREFHNLYGFFYSRAVYEGMEALDDRRGFIYGRSVWAGSQRYPAIFLGDQSPAFDHIASTLRAGLGLGLLGFAHWTADVFGLHGRTTPEQHMRYAQYALLVPVARYFWRPPQVDATRFPWSHGPANEANFRKYAQLRYRLLPYYCQLGWEAYLTGLPVLRPIVLEYPDEAGLAGVADQALLGDRLLLAPVLAPGDKAAGLAVRRIRLPAGVPWHDFWSTQTFAGGEIIDYPAPPDRLPLLVRGGSLVPMGPALSHIRDDHRFDQLELHCWPPFPAKAVFFDDDGRTRAYQRGAFSMTRLSVAGGEARGQVVVRIGPAEGGFPEQAQARQVQVVVQRSGKPRAVRVEGHAGSAPVAWHYDAERREARVSLTVQVEAGATVELLY